MSSPETTVPRQPKQSPRLIEVEANRQLKACLSGLVLKRKYTFFGDVGIAFKDDMIPHVNDLIQLESIPLHIVCKCCKDNVVFVPTRLSACYGTQRPPRLDEKPDAWRHALMAQATYNCGLCERPYLFYVGYWTRLEGDKRNNAWSIEYMPPLYFRTPQYLRENEHTQNAYNDYVGAVQGGDVFGAAYHLRAVLEHWMKAVTKTPVEQRIRGDDLCALYNSTLSDALKPKNFASQWYSELSKLVHERPVDPDDQHFTTLDKIEKAMKALDEYVALSKVFDV